jgi:RNA recognition motif-containing protein
MSRKLYVGNLPHSASEETLSAIFESYGKVKSINIISQLDKGKATCFASLSMTSGFEAQTAIRELNGTAYGGNVMKVERWPTTDAHQYFFDKAM